MRGSFRSAFNFVAALLWVALFWADERVNGGWDE